MLEVGGSYTRFSFQAPGDATGRNSLSVWTTFNPTVSVSPSVDIGVSAGYRAAFLAAPEAALDTPENRRLHALTIGATLTYRL
jgi:hypothetical protein